ncbi:MAG: hypothetical protein CM1200mP9_07110 [Gammaproteobacteria bacterium]|nr:MAG: hypothetical protein CM1200mP9_07110 [Gammaproteobacteria bacterium]
MWINVGLAESLLTIRPSDSQYGGLTDLEEEAEAGKTRASNQKGSAAEAPFDGEARTQSWRH